MNIIDGKSYEEAIEYINSLSQFVAGTGCERAAIHRISSKLYMLQEAMAKVQYVPILQVFYRKTAIRPGCLHLRI